MSNAVETASKPESRLLRWPSRLVGPPPNLKELNLACWGLLLGILVIPLCFGFWVHHRVSPGTLPPIASGFTYFYGIGKIVDTYPILRLYDYSLQLKTFNEIWTQAGNDYGPSPYPPFIALFFSLFARLSFEHAYFLWIMVSLALYGTGVLATALALFPRHPLARSLMLCLSMAYYPFLFGALLNGRISTLEIGAIGVVLLLESRTKPIFSGLALSVLTFKPTTLVLILPALLLTRRFRTLSGFLMGATVWFTATTMVTGFAIWGEYVRFARFFSHQQWLGNGRLLNYARYVDLKSLSYTLPGGRSPAGLALLAAFALAAGIALILLLWRSARAPQPVQFLVWATVLTWTLILNIYVPAYDSILVVPALALTFSAFHSLRFKLATDLAALLAVLIFAVSWFSESIASQRHIQLFTFLFALLGCLQLGLLHKALRQRLQSSSQSVDAIEIAAS